ncbi:MAG: glycosyl hydrolase 115 family protein [Bacteroidales bacterium]|nr:glycosyl hydrolase 115 family protein [Bacteroidales bacterium]
MRFFPILLLASLLSWGCGHSSSQELDSFPEIVQQSHRQAFPLFRKGSSAPVLYSGEDAAVVGIAAGLLADDVERVCGKRPFTGTADILPEGPAVVAGTIGHSALIDTLRARGQIDVREVEGRWESFLIQTLTLPGSRYPLLVIAGSDRRGTAYGLTSLCEAVGVSPWYWWADLAPSRKEALFVRPGRFVQASPAVQYRGIFINDERFGGWARWVEENFDKESGQVGPKVYEKVFELLLRLKANYLWPAMHNGSKAFNATPENALLADDYAIVMGSSHCEQMLRNNEDEWKNAGTWGDFNYITNRENMVRYWEERVRSNGRFENTYTLGLRGIHDYPMEGARTTEERRDLMQRAIDDQREILRRNIDRPLEEIPQVLCTYEEVLDAYHAGLQVPDDVIMLWSDDKQGYTRNLCNPREMERSGGAGIYYHISYHGDPASWLWLSPLSPAFLSTELTKAYTYGARKLWVFNVGDIKPAEKEITFAMELAWDPDRWAPQRAHGFIEQWAERSFGKAFAREIADIQAGYYRLQASGKDSQVWFLEYPETEIRSRLAEWQELSRRSFQLEKRIPEALKAAYFELVLYPVHGAFLANEYQLLARTSMAHAAVADADTGLADAARAREAYDALNEWTRRYNEDLLDGKWNGFFNWRPYHWYYSNGMDAPVCTEELLDKVRNAPAARFLDVSAALSPAGAPVQSEREGEIPLWIHALTPVRNASKLPEDNAFCRIETGTESFVASATPINNVWHSPLIGPMWSRVGTLHLKKGENRLWITRLEEQAEVDALYLGAYPPFPEAARTCIPAQSYQSASAPEGCSVVTVPGLGFSDGVTVLPFGTPSYTPDNAPSVEYELELVPGDTSLEIRTLPTLHVYEGRDARYAVSVDGADADIFSIHTADFSAEWRWNVLRGYSFRRVDVSGLAPGRHRVRICFLDPGIVLEQLLMFK